MRLQVAAKGLLQGWRGKVYSFGPGALDAVGSHVAELGKTALVVASGGRWLRAGLDTVVGSLQREGIRVVEAPGEAGPFVPGARPNAPRDDVFRLAAAVGQADAEVIVAIGGGSTIDAVKAAAALAALGADRGGVEQDGAVLEALFGAGRVSSALGAAGAAMRAVVAVQTAASSAAHLTKYANVTDPDSEAAVEFGVRGVSHPARELGEFGSRLCRPTMTPDLVERAAYPHQASKVPNPFTVPCCNALLRCTRGCGGSGQSGR
jgi:hypothetical protein